MSICPKCRKRNQTLGERCPDDGYYFVDSDAIQGDYIDPWLGQLIADRYVILGLLSEGGMGAVYRALQLPMRREVAVKVLLASAQDSAQVRERFAREALAISRLQHPNIITLHDFGIERQLHPFMVMEYAPGQELGSWLQQPDLSVERLYHVARQILSALSEAHRQNIVHRDLKPSNVIITRAGDDWDFAKLLDFGIARQLNEEFTRHLTRDGEVFGTPYYMAPEQARGSREVDPRADIYALGIMIYEFFSGHRPFDGETPLSILFQHLHEPLPPFEPRPGLIVPPGMADFIARATKKDAQERFEDASAMLIAFDELFGRAPRRAPSLQDQVPEESHRAETLPHESLQKTELLFNNQPQEERAGPAIEMPPSDEIPTAEVLRDTTPVRPRRRALIALFVAGLSLTLLGGGLFLSTLLFAGEEGRIDDEGLISSLEPPVLPASADEQSDLVDELPAAADNKSAPELPREEAAPTELAEPAAPAEVEIGPAEELVESEEVQLTQPISATRQKKQHEPKIPAAPPPERPAQPTPLKVESAPLPESDKAVPDEAVPDKIKKAPEPVRFDRPRVAPKRFDRPAH